MEEEFWQYSKNIYAKSSKSFLWLQDERSLDVNLLLFCYWLGEKGKRLTVDDALRKYLTYFTLPGEGQKVDRIM